MNARKPMVLLALTCSLSVVAGCSKSPTTPAPQPNVTRPSDVAVVKDVNDVRPAGGDLQQAPCPQPVAAFNAECRFIAFSACRRDYHGHSEAGSLFLYDDAIKDVYVLNGALAGLNDQVNTITGSQKQVQGPTTCSSLEELNPRAFADGKVLFNYGHEVYVWDMVAEERVTVAFDGQSERNGGPRASITADGHLLAYISNKGTVVLKETDGAYYTKTRELTKIAAEANALGNDNYHGGKILDLDISGDGKMMVLDIDGMVYAYDVVHPHLYQVLPLSGTALAGLGDGARHVAISADARYVAATIADIRLLVLDRQTGLIDTVPYANLGDTITGGEGHGYVFDPRFCADGRSLLFETTVGHDVRVWKYDLFNETLRGLVILNNALGDAGVDNLISRPNLDP